MVTPAPGARSRAAIQVTTSVSASVPAANVSIAASLPVSSAVRRGWCSSIVRIVPRENSAAISPTNTTKMNVPANAIASRKTSEPPPAAPSASIVAVPRSAGIVSAAGFTADSTMIDEPTANTTASSARDEHHARSQELGELGTVGTDHRASPSSRRR